MFERRILRGLMLAMALALTVALLPTLALANKGVPGTGAVGHTTINGNPLTIHVAADTSIQVFYAGQSAGQVYPPDYYEADSGALAWLNVAGAPAMECGPDFAKHDWYAANLVNPWQPVPPQVIAGTGTPASPWLVYTAVIFGNTLPVSQWVQYINGDDCFTVTYIIANNSPAPQVAFFHAADLYVDGEDEGFGYYDAATGAVGAWNQDRTFLEYLVPVTEMGLPPATHYQEADYHTIWNAISPVPPAPGFNDTIVATPYHDSAAGLQWDLLIPTGDFREVALDWCFLDVEEPEFVPEPGSVMLLAGGLMGLAGYAGLRMRKR